MSYFERLDSAVINVKAISHGTGAENADACDAGNLHKNLPICCGACVMLTENLWTPAGLVNGAAGYVHDVAWALDVADVCATAPFVVLVNVDGYMGPCCFAEDTGIPPCVVPIFAFSRDFSQGIAVCSCIQFPLTIAYAITVHKS